MLVADRRRRWRSARPTASARLPGARRHRRRRDLRTPRGGIVITRAGATSTRSGSSSTTWSAGTCRSSTSATRFAGPVRRGRRLRVRQLQATGHRRPPRPVSTAACGRRSRTRRRANQLTVASYQRREPRPGRRPGKFDDAGADRSSDNLRAPDILGRRGDPGQQRRRRRRRSPNADEHLPPLHRRDRRAGGPTYEYRQIDPVDNARTAASRAATSASASCSAPTAASSFVDRPGGDATTTADGDRRRPGRARGCRSARAASTRPTRRSTAAASRWPASSAEGPDRVRRSRNHFNSKGGDDPLFGRSSTPPVQSATVQRQPQAAGRRRLRGGHPRGRPARRRRRAGRPQRLPVLGDAARSWRAPALREPDGDAARAERYSYVFDGNSQVARPDPRLRRAARHAKPRATTRSTSTRSSPTRPPTTTRRSRAWSCGARATPSSRLRNAAPRARPGRSCGTDLTDEL